MKLLQFQKFQATSRSLFFIFLLVAAGIWEGDNKMIQFLMK